jgi:membrane protein YdbS with pleckstrin-like domain
MSHQHVERAARWVYQGTWGILTGWFRVPSDPPTLPALGGQAVVAFQPADGFLRYLKLYFWTALLLIDLAIVAAWLVVTFAFPVAGAILALPTLLVAVVPDIVAYVAIHLRYDTTWYVLSDRSLRIRRGIWIIHETTITFENAQNVTIRQGPIQRWYGIADILVETAGGGGSHGAEGKLQSSAAHCGLIEGVADADQIRDLIMARLRRSRSAGLGDESWLETLADAADVSGPAPWSPQHLAVLRDIRDAARKAAPLLGA